MARDYSKVKVTIEYEEISEEEQKERGSKLAQALFDAFANRCRREQQEELRTAEG